MASSQIGSPGMQVCGRAHTSQIINRTWYWSICSRAPALKTSDSLGIFVCIKIDILHLLKSALTFTWAQYTLVFDRWGGDDNFLTQVKQSFSGMESMVGAFLTLIRAFSLCLKISSDSIFFPLQILLRTLIASLTHFFKKPLTNRTII